MRVACDCDVPIATCLSGGLDSSSILCTLAAMSKSGTSRLTSDYHRAFVATFEGTGHDEREYAEAAIEKAGADARYRPMNSGALTEDLLQFAYDFEFIGHGLMLPVWAIYRELRRDGIVVSMDGLGADELPMGYPRNLKTHLMANGSLTRCPLRTFDLARTFHGQYPDGRSVASILSESDACLRSLRRMAGRVRRGFKPIPAKTQIHGSEWFSPWTSSSNDVDASERAAMNSLTPMNRDLYRQFHYTSNRNLLKMYDRMSMAHGVGVRLPFLDWRLVTYCFPLPEESKIGGGYSKRILREAMRGILPEKVRTRTRKIGFRSPLMDWMNGDLGDWVAQRVQTRHFLEGRVSNGPAIRAFVAQRHAAKDWNTGDAGRVWRHLQADLWREAFFPGKTDAPPKLVLLGASLSEVEA